VWDEGSLAGEDLVAELQEACSGMGGGGDDVSVGVLLGGVVVGALILDDGDEEGSRWARGTVEGVLSW
jgi:hypothetical protein